jgi:alkanesulfonate monooxygenase SsuD/methylene tetrahydromethanopterin reductase-like flavin-dependent oxidoreductase (luciferase family)
VDFGVVLQANPPAAKVVEYARQAELAGFGHAWTFDSHLLWQEPYVIHPGADPQAAGRPDGDQPEH